MDTTLRDYFDRIEAAFCRQRGAPLLLSPLDFEKTVEWYVAEIPADVVEAGIAAYFDRLAARKVPMRRAICLSFAEDDVLKAREERRAAAIGRGAGLAEEKPAAERISDYLRQRSSALRAFAADPDRSGAMPLLARFTEKAAGELEALLDRPGDSQARLESVLAPLDGELTRIALLESPPELVDGWNRESLERLGDLARNMDKRALDQTVERLSRQRALAHWALPRLSILYMED